MNTLLSDLKYAVRQLARSPGFASVAVLTLAVGIGANTALFSFASAIFNRPLPGVRNAERLVWVAPVSKEGGNAFVMSYPDFVDYRGLTDVFSDAAAMGGAQFSVSWGGEPVRVRGMYVSGSFFSVVGALMALGRGFLPDEDRKQGASPVVVISARFWRENFDANAGIVGRAITINGRSYTIVGVAPDRFNGVDHAERRDLWVPLAMAGTSVQSLQGLLTQRGNWWLSAVARLRPDVSLETAQTAVEAQAARIGLADSAGHGWLSSRVFPLRGGMSPNDMNDVAPIGVLAGAVTLLVLLIACANVSNLLLGKAVARRREIAVRLSLGAARTRILRQLLTESVVLAGLGATVGLLISIWATEGMAAILPSSIDVSPDVRVLLFTIAAAVVTGIAFGIVPAFHATRSDVSIALKDANVGFDRRRSRLQGGFVVAQVSLSLVLLVMAGMFLGALFKANRVDVRFEATNRVLAASFDLGLQGYTTELADDFVMRLQARAGALPGVQGVTTTNQVPMGERLIGGAVVIEGRAPVGRFDEEGGMEIAVSDIRPNYFRVLGIPLMGGRDFTDNDRRDTPPVVIVSEDFARQAWGDSSAIGKRISLSGANGPWATVIGVARVALTMGVPRMNRPTRPVVYVAQRQNASVHDLTLLVRAIGPATNLAPAVRGIIREMDNTLPVFGVRTLDAYRYESTSEARLGSTLLAIFGSLALVLATIGVYAVMAFSVGQRTREVGVRVALGAAYRQIVGLFIWEGARLALIGVAIGLFLSAAMTKLLAAVFFGLSVTDAVTFAAGALLLLGAGMLASVLPARRAARSDPMVALRHE